ncbi:hypothetical protein B0T26DRAFT_736549 [Lasiosphaeria miniovina]|uniref:Nucleoporin NUP53 n=1 Tax=Lasiosphaeria miniovina TaxID=1954250 RepID=A0AA40BG78_9PEZI|nr:uncharacterized protein B0T26DRAFT_736549 [Lasiosphaeria miniovina]KAK0733666.1 hypothetical protein B0T26DRAFT_736549 [Lasiosphaeria miniovina]
MAPLILHNVPDEELYIGDDGVQRPYAMVFPQQDGPPGRSRKSTVETGSFGKSTRRSRSKTGTPARREDATIAAADRVFSSWIQNQNQSQSPVPANPTEAGQRKSSQPGLGATLDEGTALTTRFATKREPTEVILRGYRSPIQQYAAINHFEQLAGTICEDYSREPPVESRRYKSELRDPAFTRRRALTPEERTKVNKAHSGEHWVKVTFESAEAAEAAMFTSPQSILGHLVYAEPYHGIPPSRDEAVPDVPVMTEIHDNHAFTRAMMNSDSFDFSPPHSYSSSRTADTTTVTSASGGTTNTVSSGTVTNGRGASTGLDTELLNQHEQQRQQEQEQRNPENEFCRAIPTVRKVKLLPVEQALLPAPTYTQRALNHVPFFRYFSGSMIGNEVPRTDAGEFDWDKASLYWKLIWWLDSAFGLFGGEILNADKDD